MEINHWGDTIIGAVAQEDLVEGRMVHLCANAFSRNFGSQADLPGCELPDSAAESAASRYVVTFESDNRKTPIYEPHPAFSYALRYGFDQDANAPFDATVYLTHPQVQEGLTIPSGSGCVLFGEGIYTVPSGAYIYDAIIETPGVQLEVDNSGSNAGKLKVYDSGGIVAEVVYYDDDTAKLTFKILH